MVILILMMALIISIHRFYLELNIIHYRRKIDISPPTGSTNLLQHLDDYQKSFQTKCLQLHLVVQRYGRNVQPTQKQQNILCEHLINYLDTLIFIQNVKKLTQWCFAIFGQSCSGFGKCLSPSNAFSPRRMPCFCTNTAGSFRCMSNRAIMSDQKGSFTPRSIQQKQERKLA